jgi:hypothetical protein
MAKKKSAPKKSAPTGSTKSSSEPKTPRPYVEWRTDPNHRWRDAFHTFGHLLMSHARDDAIGRIPAKATKETKEIAAKAAENALYNVMMILEGVVGVPSDGKHNLEFALMLRVKDRKDKLVEEFELAPEGDEPACMGFHFWTDGDFRK